MSTDPNELLRSDDPVGVDNDGQIGSLPENVPIVAAWGAHKAAAKRIDRVMQIVNRPLLCIRKTATGAPEHPLYLPGNLKPIPLVPTSQKDSP